MTEAHRASRGLLLLTVTYGVSIVYGSLYPLSGWSQPSLGFSDALARSWPEHVSRTDLAANLLIYLPLGLLLALALRRKLSSGLAMLVATALSSALSGVLECLQAYLPGRVFSSLDLLANAAGALIGAVVATGLRQPPDWSRKILALRREWLLPGRVADLGLWALAAWALSQLSPLLPSADLGDIRHGLRPLWNTLRQLERFEIQHAAVFFFSAAGLGLLVSTLARPGRSVLRGYAVFFVVVLLLKVPVVTRQLSLEALIGAVLGLGLLWKIQAHGPRQLVIVAASAILAAFLLDGLRAEAPFAAAQTGQPMNWIPFGRHSTNFLVALADAGSGAWPFLALTRLARLSLAQHRAPVVALVGGVGVALTAFAVEWAQQSLPGRTPDITDVIVALAAWVLAWWMTGRVGTRLS